MPSRGSLISLDGFAAAFFPAATADGAAPAASYSLSAYNCSKMNCEPPFQSRKGAWSAATQDRVEMETGIPFQLRIASGPTFYGKSLATVQGDSITLSNHIQMANFEKWTRALKKPASQTVGPAYVAGNITDTLTIAGGDGIAYLLPIYEVAGTFASSGEKFFGSRTFLCFGTTPRGDCELKIWLSPGDGSNVHEFSQPKPGETLQLDRK